MSGSCNDCGNVILAALLKQREVKLVEALRFYADHETWYSDLPRGTVYDQITEGDLDERNDCFSIIRGGKKARQALKECEEIVGGFEMSGECRKCNSLVSFRDHKYEVSKKAMTVEEMENIP